MMILLIMFFIMIIVWMLGGVNWLWLVLGFLAGMTVVYHLKD